jgi:hypothetical protein
MSYEVVNYPQFDIDYSEEHDSEELDCEMEDVSFQEASYESTAIQSVGSWLTTNEQKKTNIQDLPPELLLNILLQVEDPFDIVSFHGVNRFFHSFISKHSGALARQQLSCVELRGITEDRESTIVMNMTGTYYGSKRLWKGLCFNVSTIRDMNIEMFAPKLMFHNNSTIRLDDIKFTNKCLPSFAKFIEKMIRIDYPGYRRRINFELQINNCSFESTAQKDIPPFINKMIKLGCTNMAINSVKFEDYKKLCLALSNTRLHLLDVFRFHSDDITSNRAETLKHLFKPFCRLGRNINKIVIDGIQIPLEICEWVMIQFCCTQYYLQPPPSLRVVMSIHRNYVRQELFDMLKGVRVGVEHIRSRLRHRLNHVYLELGMYESDVYLTQNQHCVVDVKLMKPKNRNAPTTDQQQQLSAS